MATDLSGLERNFGEGFPEGRPVGIPDERIHDESR